MEKSLETLAKFETAVFTGKQQVTRFTALYKRQVALSDYISYLPLPVREDALMIKITLTDPDRQQLEHTFKTTADRRLRDRCQAILMADRGRRHHQIAEDLRVTSRTLQRWLNAYCAGGLAGLTITGLRDAL